MGGGALEPKTVTGVSKKAFYKKKQKAFTLAEVLITLAIIGVVAALTIPTVVAKYQQKMYYTQFMKVYNTLSNAIELANEENGRLANGCGSYIPQDYLLPFLKVAKIVDRDDNEEINYDFTMLAGGETMKTVDGFFGGYLGGVVVLADGAYIASNTQCNGDFDLQIDTNGKKGPNVIGRDMFFLEYEDGILRGYKYIPETISLGVDKDGEEQFDYANCNPNESFSGGDGCADRLLQEGAMNY